MSVLWRDQAVHDIVKYKTIRRLKSIYMDMKSSRRRQHCRPRDLSVVVGAAKMARTRIQCYRYWRIKYSWVEHVHHGLGERRWKLPLVGHLFNYDAIIYNLCPLQQRQPPRGRRRDVVCIIAVTSPIASTRIPTERGPRLAKLNRQRQQLAVRVANASDAWRSDAAPPSAPHPNRRMLVTYILLLASLRPPYPPSHRVNGSSILP